MNKRIAVALMLLTACVCALPRVQAQAANWLLEVVMVGIPQTQIVRDSRDKNRYYLCWSDGSSRYGLKFSRRNFDYALQQMPMGKRAPLANVLKLDPGGWTATDEKTCWGK